jgi:hypothetical protein
MKRWMIFLLIILSSPFSHAQGRAAYLEEVELFREDPDAIPMKDLQTMNQINGFDVRQEVPIVILINKSAEGPGAQRLHLYQYGIETANWKISTGRERLENSKNGRQYFSTTPSGWFYPHWAERNHWSNTWETDMEFAVFFNGGIAIHATTASHYRQLGQRASGGCIRLYRAHAEYIYSRILEEGKSPMPLFYRDGRVVLDSKGQIVRKANWRALFIVEDSAQD